MAAFNYPFIEFDALDKKNNSITDLIQSKSNSSPIVVTCLVPGGHGRALNCPAREFDALNEKTLQVV
jgi:hypothetical protein